MYGLILKGKAIFYKGVEVKILTAIKYFKSQFPTSSASKLLLELPKTADQYKLHPSFARLFTKWDLVKEIDKLHSKSSNNATQEHIEAIIVLLRILEAFKSLNEIFFTRNMNENEISKLTSLRSFFSQLAVNNNLSGNFGLFCNLIDIALKFTHRPFGIYLDIVIAYLLVHLVSFYNITNITEFEHFMKLLKNKKVFMVLCPHIFLVCCQFV